MLEVFLFCLNDKQKLKLGNTLSGRESGEFSGGKITGFKFIFTSSVKKCCTRLKQFSVQCYKSTGKKTLAPGFPRISINGNLP